MSVDTTFAGTQPRTAVGPCNCRNGMLGDVHTDGPGPLYLLLVYQAKNKTLRFCDCESGQMMRRYLMRRFRQLETGEDYVPPGMATAIDEWIGAGMPEMQRVWNVQARVRTHEQTTNA